LSSFEAKAAALAGGQVSRRSLFLGAGFLAVAAAAFVVTPRRHEQTLGRSRLADVVPQRLGPWSPAPNGGLILPDADQPGDVYDQVLARTYVAANLPPMMLLVAYGAAQSGLMKVHRPETCYTSSGFAIRDDRAIDVPLVDGGAIAARTFLASREDRAEQVLYWTRISDTFPRDLASQRLVMLELGIRGIIPDGILVRCSTLGADGAKGEKALLGFVETLIANAGPAGRGFLIGAARSMVPAEKDAGP
jgi:EpsI family protein